MKFKLDENLPFSLKRIIESSGAHQVDSVLHEGLVGTDDHDLIKHCFDEQRILITLDNDFIHSHLAKSQKIYGVILLKSLTQGKKAVNSLFNSFINNYDLQDTQNKILIVQLNQIKIRLIS
ncbi:MAG: hypothetical protein HeimC3_46710 [Candidatus Heimdallarchaeota archaeon LC_3]|nr:MAG: hypothetical protein HeimC3_46710 [Candidatus Heimdallarchaeota archaeon LC_3]